MINSFSKKALAETTEDTRSYYWLGFEPPRNEDDRLHDIRVRLAGRRDLRVRTREHYLDMSKGHRGHDAGRGCAAVRRLPRHRVPGGALRHAPEGRLPQDLRADEVTIPLDDVELLPMNGQWMNELEFRIRLMDKFGDQAAPPAAKLPVLIPNEPRPGDLFVFETDLRLRKRKHRYVAAIYDPLTGGLVSASGHCRAQVDKQTPEGSTPLRLHTNLYCHAAPGRTPRRRAGEPPAGPVLRRDRRPGRQRRSRRHRQGGEPDPRSDCQRLRAPGGRRAGADRLLHGDRRGHRPSGAPDRR